MKRRVFVATCAGALASLPFLNMSCKTETSSKAKAPTTNAVENKNFWFELSLAQWSLNKAIRGGKMDPMNFAQVARELGFTGLEYVNHLYTSYLEKFGDNLLGGVKSMAKELTTRANDHNMQNLIFMIDERKDLAVNSPTIREEAIALHHKWIDAAHEMGCHSIRTNLFGDGTDEEVAEHGANSWRKLCEYAKPLGLNVLIENHGWQTSNPSWLVDVLKNVSMDNAGLLPDFGNFCVKRKDGEKWGECIEEYPDPYEGIKMMMPYAKGVSAKSYQFDANGDETKIDYAKMLDIVKKAGYQGHIGVEFEGEGDEKQGILATKTLLEKLA